MFLIAKGKKLPIPKNISNLLADFIKSCLKKNPSERVNALKLSNHNFLIDKTKIHQIPIKEVNLIRHTSSKKIFPENNESEDEEGFEKRIDNSPFIDDSFSSQNLASLNSKKDLNPHYKKGTWIPSLRNLDHEPISSSATLSMSFPSRENGFLNTPDSKKEPFFPKEFVKKNIPNPPPPPPTKLPKLPKLKPKPKHKRKIIESEEKVEIKIEMKKIHKTIVQELNSEEDEEKDNDFA